MDIERLCSVSTRNFSRGRVCHLGGVEEESSTWNISVGTLNGEGFSGSRKRKPLNLGFTTTLKPAQDVRELLNLNTNTCTETKHIFKTRHKHCVFRFSNYFTCVPHIGMKWYSIAMELVAVFQKMWGTDQVTSLQWHHGLDFCNNEAKQTF